MVVERMLASCQSYLRVRETGVDVLTVRPFSVTAVTAVKAIVEFEGVDEVLRFELQPEIASDAIPMRTRGRSAGRRG